MTDGPREPMPERIAPMRARPGALPPDDGGWGYEVKWDGIRALMYAEGGRMRLLGRNFSDFTPRYPELRELAGRLLACPAVLDGEVVTLDERGRPSFERLQSRMHLASDAAVRVRMRDIPATYLIFDVLYLDGHLVLDLPYRERRRLLRELELEGPAWRTPAHHEGDGAAVLDGTRRLGVEGVVAKRLDSPYEPGRRSSAWLKVKNLRSQDVVIGGYTPGGGSRGGSLGALVVGYHERGRLLYAGKVGSGFSDQTLALLRRELAPLVRPGSPFEGRQPERGTVFVEPRLVAHVEFREWTASGTLRAPSFKGLRADVDPLEVVREPQVSARPGGPGAAAE